MKKLDQNYIHSLIKLLNTGQLIKLENFGKELLKEYYDVQVITKKENFDNLNSKIIKDIQLALYRLGRYTGKIDGNYNKQTQNALWSFCVVENQKHRWTDESKIDPKKAISFHPVCFALILKSHSGNLTDNSRTSCNSVLIFNQLFNKKYLSVFSGSGELE